MKLSKTQRGFSAVESLLIVVILGLVGFTGWFVYHSKQTADKTLASSNSTVPVPQKKAAITTFAQCQAATGSKVEETFPERCVTKDGKTFTNKMANTPTAQQYLVIKEWDVKISMKDAAKATYTYDRTPSSGVGGSYDSLINLLAKSEFLDDKTCDVSVGMERSTKIPDMPQNSYKKLGNYYYWINGSPYACSSDADNKLNQSLRSDFTIDNLQQV